MNNRQKGQSLLEFALLLPILLIMLMGLLDLGRAYYAIVALEDMAGEGAAYASIHPMDIAGVQQRVSEAGGGLVYVGPSMVTVTHPPSVLPGAPITVTISYPFVILTPFVQGMVSDGTLMLYGTATEPIISVQ